MGGGAPFRWIGRWIPALVKSRSAPAAVFVLRPHCETEGASHNNHQSVSRRLLADWNKTVFSWRQEAAVDRSISCVGSVFHARRADHVADSSTGRRHDGRGRQTTKHAVQIKQVHRQLMSVSPRCTPARVQAAVSKQRLVDQQPQQKVMLFYIFQVFISC